MKITLRTAYREPESDGITVEFFVVCDPSTSKADAVSAIRKGPVDYTEIHKLEDELDYANSRIEYLQEVLETSDKAFANIRDQRREDIRINRLGVIGLERKISKLEDTLEIYKEKNSRLEENIYVSEHSLTVQSDLLETKDRIIKDLRDRLDASHTFYVGARYEEERLLNAKLIKKIEELESTIARKDSAFKSTYRSVIDSNTYFGIEYHEDYCDEEI